MDIAIVLQVDANNPVVGDLRLDNGTVRLANKDLRETVAQDLMIALKLVAGEWFLDPTQGIPYFQAILGQKTPLTIVAQIFRRAILSRPGITTINSFTIAPLPNRTLRLDFAVTITDGTLLLSSDYAPFIVGT